MMHWKGHGYLAIATPVVAIVAGITLNDYVFHGQFSSARTAGVSCILAACLLAWMLRVSPKLRSFDYCLNNNKKTNVDMNAGKVESSLSIKNVKSILGKNREVYRNSLMWLPLEVYVPFWVAIGIWYYFWK